MRDENEYWGMAPGTRLDMGTTAIEFIGEFNWEYVEPTEDDESAWQITLPNDRILAMGECLNLDSAVPFMLNVSAEWHGITHDTINSGYLIRVTNDCEGAYVAHHWGKGNDNALVPYV